MLKIHRVNAFDDNYIWVISDHENAWVVDPGDAAPVIGLLESYELSLQGILLTHWHGDHQGGVLDLCARFAGIEVIGSHKTLKGPSRPVSEGDVVHVLGADFEVIEVPGHTLDHVAYASISDQFPRPVAFTGDTLFAAGCGRLFEGSAENMFSSLNKINQLPENTEIYCAHEYTLTNLNFAVVAEPNNEDIQKRQQQVSEMRAKGMATVPTTLKLERLTNPFLRAITVAQLAKRRLQKDHF
jgi:hydroxyacylglutathione hydrolase